MTSSTIETTPIGVKPSQKDLARPRMLDPSFISINNMFEVEVLIICHVEKSRLKLFMIYLIIVLCKILTFN